jgi:hypothetical protein
VSIAWSDLCAVTTVWLILCTVQHDFIHCTIAAERYYIRFTRSFDGRLVVVRSRSRSNDVQNRLEQVVMCLYSYLSHDQECLSSA